MEHPVELNSVRQDSWPAAYLVGCNDSQVYLEASVFDCQRVNSWMCFKTNYCESVCPRILFIDQERRRPTTMRYRLRFYQKPRRLELQDR